MDINVVSQLIGSLGFPIVACCGLFWFGYKMVNKLSTQLESERLTHKDEVDKLTECINNNTQVLTKLVTLMETTNHVA